MSANIDDIRTLDLENVIPADLRPKFEEHKELGFDGSPKARLELGRRRGPHPITILLLLQWVIADGKASSRRNGIIVSAKHIRSKHGKVHDPRTYKKYLDKLEEYDVIEKSKWGGDPRNECYTLPEDVELAPVFREIAAGNDPELTMNREDDSELPVYNSWMPTSDHLIPSSPREWFEDRYQSGFQIFAVGVFLTAILTEIFRLTTFEPNSSAIPLLGYLIAFGVVAMIIGTVEIARDSYLDSISNKK